MIVKLLCRDRIAIAIDNREYFEKRITIAVENREYFKKRIPIAVESKQDPKLIKCYNEKTGGKFQQCWRDDGFETCFTKFSPGGKQTKIEKLRKGNYIFEFIL